MELPSIFQDEDCRTGAVDHLFVMKEWFVRGYTDYMVPPGRSRSPASMVNELAFPWLDEHANVAAPSARAPARQQ